jgi:hypothetical protein
VPLPAGLIDAFRLRAPLTPPCGERLGHVVRCAVRRQPDLGGDRAQGVLGTCDGALGLGGRRLRFAPRRQRSLECDAVARPAGLLGALPARDLVGSHRRVEIGVISSEATRPERVRQRCLGPGSAFFQVRSPRVPCGDLASGSGRRRDGVGTLLELAAIGRQAGRPSRVGGRMALGPCHVSRQRDRRLRGPRALDAVPSGRCAPAHPRPGAQADGQQAEGRADRRLAGDDRSDRRHGCDDGADDPSHPTAGRAGRELLLRGVKICGKLRLRIGVRRPEAARQGAKLVLSGTAE